MKKIVALMLAAVMVLSMVSLVNAEGEKVKLKAVFIAHPLTQSVYDMEWLMEIEEEAGVDIEWEQIYTDWNQVKSTRFASGDIPDLLFNATSDSDYTTYDGLFMELTDLIDQYAPNVKAMFAEEPDTLALAKLGDGRIFATPKFQGKWPDCNGVMFINKNWLDKLGLEKPTTLSELKNVLIAFRDNDANGNGNPSDEVPMDFNGWFGGAYSLSNLIGSWGIQLVNWAYDGYFAEGGVIKNYAVDERYKAMMSYLADLNAEGLINPNAITNDYSMFQSLSRGDSDGNALVGVVLGWEETDKFGPTLYSQYVPCGPFVDDVDDLATAEPRWTYDFSGLNMSSNRVAMSAKCADPVAAMKFIDKFYEPQRSVEGLFGGGAGGFPVLEQGQQLNLDSARGNALRIEPAAGNRKIIIEQQDILRIGRVVRIKLLLQRDVIFLRHCLNADIVNTGALRKRFCADDLYHSESSSGFSGSLFSIPAA